MPTFVSDNLDYHSYTFPATKEISFEAAMNCN